MHRLLILALALGAIWPRLYFPDRGDAARQPAQKSVSPYQVDVQRSLADSLLHYWPMSESSPTAPRADWVGDLDLTPAGDGVPTMTGHIYDHAAYWDGTVADALILSKAAYAGTDIDAEGDYPRTYAAWVYPVGDWSSRVGYYDFVWQRQEGLGFGGEEFFLNANGGAIYRIYDDDKADINLGLCDGLPYARHNTWQLIFWTHDPTTDTISTHVWLQSGAQPEDHIDPVGAWPYGLSPVGSNPIAPPGRGDLHIGGASLFANQPRNAHFALGPLMVFDKVLDASEKAALWNNGAGLPYSAMTPTRLYLPLLRAAA